MAKDDTAPNSTAAGQRAPAFWPLRLAICYGTIVACLPYLTLKALWLFGYSPGAANAEGAGALVAPRHVVGNVITAGMELVAIALILALTYPWGQRLPAWLLATPIWVGVGLLAPILVGLPLGLVAQAFAGGSPAPAENGLDGWVYAIVYGGFVVQAVGLLLAFVGYALDRWPGAFRIRTPQLKAGGIDLRRVATVAAIIISGYAALLAAWSVMGQRWGGPAGFETVAQRSFLLATGIIVLAGAIAALCLVWRWGHGSILAPLVLAWVGMGVAVPSGPTHIALSNQGEVSLLLVVATVIAVVSGLTLTGSTLRVLARSSAV